MSFHVDNGQLYRARATVGVATFYLTTVDGVTTALQSLGFKGVGVWFDAAHLPPDWPSGKGAYPDLGLDHMIFAEGVWAGPSMELEFPDALSRVDIWPVGAPSSIALPPSSSSSPTTPSSTPPSSSSSSVPDNPASTQDAAAIATQALTERLGRTPTDAELGVALAVGRIENDFGRALYQDPTTHKRNVRAPGNWGTVQDASDRKPGPADLFVGHVAVWEGEGEPIGYVRTYAKSLDGARDMVRVLVQDLGTSWPTSVDELGARLAAAHYFDARIVAQYTASLDTQNRQNERDLGRPLLEHASVRGPATRKTALKLLAAAGVCGVLGAAIGVAYHHA